MSEMVYDPADAPAWSGGKPAWGAVGAMTLGVFGLVTAEFLPASLLTPIAGELSITEGMAGQAVTATAVVALFTGLFVAAVTRNIDRRPLLIFFAALLIVSNLLVALAPGMTLLLIGRIMLGVALGGFWSLSAAIAMRLVEPALVPRALSIIFSGVSAATVLAAPLGSFLGEMFGWRFVFLVAAAIGVVALVAQLLTLPRLPPSGNSSMRTIVEVIGRPGVAAGVVTVILVFSGHFAFFTYIRPFLETVTGVGINAVSAILLGFGVANFFGTLMAGPMIERSLRMTLMTMPLLMGALALALVALGTLPLAAAVLVGIWGLAFGAVPVAWSTWLTRTVPDQAEAAGGLFVASIQFAIALGAVLGGVIFDASDANGVFSASGAILLAAALGILIGIRAPRPATAAAAA